MRLAYHCDEAHTTVMTQTAPAQGRGHGPGGETVPAGHGVQAEKSSALRMSAAPSPVHSRPSIALDAGYMLSAASRRPLRVPRTTSGRPAPHCATTVEPEMFLPMERKAAWADSVLTPASSGLPGSSSLPRLSCGDSYLSGPPPCYNVYSIV